MNRSVGSIQSCIRIYSRRYFSQTQIRGAQEKYIFHEVEFTGTKTVETKHGPSEPRIPFNNSHLLPGDSYLYPYLQTAKPILSLNPNLESILESEDGSEVMDYFVILSGGVLNRKQGEIGLLFETGTEALASLVGDYWSKELRQNNPKARNASNLSGHLTTVTAPTRFQTTSPWFEFESECLLKEYWKETMDVNSEGVMVQKMPWSWLEFLLSEDESRSKAFLNLLVTQMGKLHREERSKQPNSLELQFWRFARSRTFEENTETMQKLGSMLSDSWGKGKFEVANIGDLPVLNLKGANSIEEFLDWIGPCVIPGEQHRFITGEQGLP